MVSPPRFTGGFDGAPGRNISLEDIQQNRDKYIYELSKRVLTPEKRLPLTANLMNSGRFPEAQVHQLSTQYLSRRQMHMMAVQNSLRARADPYKSLAYSRQIHPNMVEQKTPAPWR